MSHAPQQLEGRTSLRPRGESRGPASRRRVAAGLAVLAVLGGWLFVARAASRMPDFEVYWRAGARAAAAAPLYRPEDGDYQFKYFPAFAVAMQPLAALPLPVAKSTWFAASFAAWIALLALAVRALPARRQPAWWIVGVLVVGLGKYYVEDLVLGQINILLTLIVTLALLSLAAGRAWLGGALIGLAIVVKPYALILLPWLVTRPQRRAIAAAVAVLAAASVLPVLTYGAAGSVGQYAEWGRTVTQTTAGVLTHSNNISVASLFAKWLGPSPTAAGLTAIGSLALLAFAAGLLLRRRGVASPDGLEAGVLLLLTPLLSPQGWDYVAVVATLTFAWLANDYDRLPRALQITAAACVLVIGLTLYDLLGRRLVYLLLEHGAVTVAFAGVLAAAWALRARRIA